MSKSKPIAFILGVPRSGTTLLRVMLAGHPGLFSPPEMIIAPFTTMAERAEVLKVRFWEKGGLRRALMDLRALDVEGAKAAERALIDETIPEVYAQLQAEIGDRMLVDKCPHLCAFDGALDRVTDWFPEARFIWIVRHPGSVVRSLENMPMAEVLLKGYAGGAPEMWHRGNLTVQRFLEKIPGDRHTMVRYEELVEDPGPALERVCATLGVPFDEAVLHPYEGDRMREGPQGARAVGDPNLAGRGKIQPELATKWLEGFDPRRLDQDARALARDLGYDLGALELPPIAKVGDALTALWDTARELEKSIDIPMDLDAVEGRRFLLRMISASVDMFCEWGDTDRPRFHHSESAERKMFGDCPDADYLRAPIRLGPGAAYRVWGRIPKGTLDVGILYYGKGGRIGNRMSDGGLTLDAEGRFELRLSTEEQPGTWLQGDGDETAIMFRQYFTDRATQAPIEVHIERLGELPAPAPLAALPFARSIERARRMLRAIFTRTLEAYRQVSVAAINRFIEIPAEKLFPTPDNRYRVAWYRLGYNQLMLVRGRLPRARYFGLTFYNTWLESFDYLRHRVNLNHDTLVTEPDGSFEVCVAHRDPGHPNWLDTAGHEAGYLVARALLPEGDLPDLTIEVLYETEWEARRAATA